MAMGPLTWTCLMLAVHAGAPDVWHMNQRGFQIPIRVQPERRHEIKELLLYVSKDMGQTWELQARSTPDKEAFAFSAPQDGAFWFKVAVVDARGRQEPPDRDVPRAPVGQRIVVDTVKPDLHLVVAERQGEEVVVRWTAREEHPETESLRLEYRTESPGAAWTAVRAVPGEQGEARFKPGPGAVTVRLQLKDQAGNQGVAETTVPAAGGPAANQVVANQTAGKPPAPPAPVESPTPATLVGGTPPPPARTEMVPGTFPPPGPSAPVEGADASGLRRTNLASTTRSSLPPLRIINKRQVKLDFDVARFGPSGLGNVDVYITLDDGQTWERSPTDADAVLPAVSDATPVHGSVTVQLNKEAATYGFYVVVKSRAGLGKPPPQRGDTPHVRIEVDTTPPRADLFEPKPDPGRRDALVLTWRAADRNLAPTPITLEWAESKDGPWSLIGDPELPNAGGSSEITGRYVWQVPNPMPPKVYLRLTARDTAGNVCVAQTPTPILVDLTVPEVTNIGLSPR